MIARLFGSSKEVLPPVVYVVLAAGGAAYFLGNGISIIRRAKATLRWKSVDGTITSALTEQREHPLVFLRQLGSSTRARAMNAQYRADIQYVYQVGGKDYIGKRLFFGEPGWRNAPGQARVHVARYAPGTRVRVYYDPARPAEAVLQRGEDRIGKRYVEIGVLFALLTGYAAWVAAVNGLWRWQ